MKHTTLRCYIMLLNPFFLDHFKLGHTPEDLPKKHFEIAAARFLLPYIRQLLTQVNSQNVFHADLTLAITAEPYPPSTSNISPK